MTGTPDRPATTPEGAGLHDFVPVAGHPDDDECTYRSDGTDATYCGEPRAWHDDLLWRAMEVDADVRDSAATLTAEDRAELDALPALSERTEGAGEVALSEEDAWWREMELGNLTRDRGGYTRKGFAVGFAAARRALPTAGRVVDAPCRHQELPDTMWSRLRRAETDARNLAQDKATLSALVTQLRERAVAAEAEVAELRRWRSR